MEIIKGHSGPPLLSWQDGVYVPFDGMNPFSKARVYYRSEDPSPGIVKHEEGVHSKQAGGFFGRLYWSAVWHKKSPFYDILWRQRVTWEVEATSAQFMIDGGSLGGHAERISSEYSSGKLSYVKCLKELKDANAKHS